MRAVWFTGDYRTRQTSANAGGVACYLEGHFNASANPKPNYACVVVAKDAGELAKEWGRSIAAGISQAFGIATGGTDGLLVGGFAGRGDGNLRLCEMPAVLIEPWFVSNADGASWARSAEAQVRLARVIADSIRAFFPGAESVGLSIGHKGKSTSPKDMGAAVLGGGTEALYAEMYLRAVAALLEGEA